MGWYCRHVRTFITPLKRFAWNRAYSLSRWKLPIQLLAILTLSLCSIHNLRAQTTTSGGLTGVLSDPSHPVMPDAVLVLRANTNASTQTSEPITPCLYR